MNLVSFSLNHIQLFYNVDKFIWAAQGKSLITIGTYKYLLIQTREC